MSTTSLHHFVDRVLAEDRILFADIKRLQRDILPAPITSREDAEILLFLDSAVHRTDRAWAAYLIVTIRDFAVWGLDPAGSLDRGKAEWIMAALACAAPPKTARVILREILQEARRIDPDAFLELGQAHRSAGRTEAGQPAKGTSAPPAGS